MLETKSEFARRVGRTRQCVNGWIKAGKVDGDALVRQGTNVLVDVDKAQAQLALRLDAGQRLGNGLDTKLSPAAPKPIGATPSSAAGGDVATMDRDEVDGAQRDALDEGIKREKLTQLQRINRKGSEEEAARRGRYVLAGDVSRAMQIVAAKSIRVFEGTIPELSSALAAKFSIDEREVSLCIAGVFRTARDEAARRHQAKAESLPRFPSDPAQA